MWTRLQLNLTQKRRVVAIDATKELTTALTISSLSCNCFLRFVTMFFCFCLKRCCASLFFSLIFPPGELVRAIARSVSVCTENQQRCISIMSSLTTLHKLMICSGRPVKHGLPKTPCATPAVAQDQPIAPQQHMHCNFAGNCHACGAHHACWRAQINMSCY